jgi:hypothetical protein
LRGEQLVFVHAPAGAAPFAACLQLFRSYPLAVTQPDPAADGQRSMVLRHRGSTGDGYYLLTQRPDERFALCPWDGGDEEGQEIRPGRAVPVASHRVIAQGMPVPRDSALLGWVSDRQAIVLLSVYHGDPGQPPGVPQVRALALVGSDPVRWPPCITSPLDDGQLWRYVARGELVDLAAVVARGTGSTFWVPSQNAVRAARGHGCVVVSRHLTADAFWLPSGTYMDHWLLREGVPTPPARHLLTLPGVSGLGGRLAAAPVP